MAKSEIFLEKFAKIPLISIALLLKLIYLCTERSEMYYKTYCR